MDEDADLDAFKAKSSSNGVNPAGEVWLSDGKGFLTVNITGRHDGL
ncbi:MAG: hypothetical protein ACYC0V_19225 [Armatimonadota bacterium]